MTESLRTPPATTTEGLRSASSTGRKSMRADVAPPEWETMMDAASAQWWRTHPTPLGCTLIGRQGIAGYGTAGCAVAGVDLGLR